jgi:hypothetical protein
MVLMHEQFEETTIGVTYFLESELVYFLKVLDVQCVFCGHFL